MSIGWITYAGSTNWIGEDGVASLHALTLNTSSVAENTAAGVLVGTLRRVTDGSTLSLTDTAGNRFALDGLTIETGATSTNFEAANSHNITVRETLDGYPNSPRDSVISITVTNVFEAASLNALTLDTDEVEEGTAAGTLVGTLQDVTSGSTLSLTDDADGRFVLDGEDVETGATATDYDAATSHNITVRETLADSANSPRDSIIAITVTELITVPAQFGTGDWSVTNPETSGDITITITTLPDDGGSAITDLEYQLDGGSWVSLSGTTTGDYPVSGLTDDQEYDVAIRAVNAIGNGTASATKAVTPTEPFSPLNLSPTVWYDPSDLSSLFTDDGVTNVTTDGQSVYRMNDKSGNGHHLRQATLANRPLYKTSGGLHWLLFDGVNDYLRSDTGAIVAQPTTHCHALQMITNAANANAFNGAVDTAAVQSFYSDATNWETSAGTATDVVVHDTAANVWTHVFNGASSSVRQNGVSASTGNYGANGFRGLTIAANRVNASCGNIRYYGGFVKVTNLLSSDGVSSIEEWMASKSGVTL